MSYHQLTSKRRYQIYGLHKEGFTQKAIAENLGVHPATISRELRRNRGQRGYRPEQAHRLCKQRQSNATKAIKMTEEVRGWITQLLEKDLSPEQVVLYLEQEKGIRLHHETVYQFVYDDKQKGGALHQHLRIANKPYRKRYGKYDRRGQIKNRVSIDERPEIVDKRARIGDWEGDTVIGKGHKGALLTLVERKTLYTVIVPLKGKLQTS